MAKKSKGFWLMWTVLMTSFELNVEYVEELVTRVGIVTHVIGDVVHGGLPPGGTRLVVRVPGRAPLQTVLRGVDLSVRRPKVGIHLLGLSASEIPTGETISFELDENS